MLFVRTEEHAKKKIETALQEGFDGKIECVAVDALFDGLRLLQERSFDLIISDLVLPDSTGVATVRHLKQQAPGTPVIVLCDFKDRAMAVTAVRKGAHDFLCYEDLRDLENLRRAVAGALRSGDEEHANQPHGADRRTNARFPCRLAVSYQALEHPFLSGVATSETLNISSKGLLFTTEEAASARTTAAGFRRLAGDARQSGPAEAGGGRQDRPQHKRTGGDADRQVRIQNAPY